MQCNTCPTDDLNRCTPCVQAADIADELWAPGLMLGLLIISAIGAAAKLGSEGGNQSQPLALCLVWTLFNIIPLARMLCYVAMRKHWTFMVRLGARHSPSWVHAGPSCTGPAIDRPTKWRHPEDAIWCHAL